MRYRILFLMLFAPLMASVLWAQADRLLGTYHVVHGKVESDVRITKQANGTYQCQVLWVSDQPGPDGKYGYDVKNPDPALRNVRLDRVVLMDGLVYKPELKVWGDARIYDPTSGKSYRVELSFKDDKTLTVKGMWGPFSRKIYWEKK